MHIQPIGRGMNRINITSQRVLTDLAKLPGVQVDGERVYFPDSLARMIQSIEREKDLQKREQEQPQQTDLFM